jgi:pimeloyl-ACP methyl ester carboxylesterase
MREKILFLPSAWSNELVFQPQITALSRHYDIEVVDVACFETISQTVKHIINNYKNIYCLIGLSLGGFAALELIADYPDFVTRAILIGTQAHALDNESKLLYSNIIQQVEQGKLAELCLFFADVVTGKASKNNQKLMHFIKEMPLIVGNQGCINHHKAAISYQDQTHKLKRIRSRVLILFGEEDKGTPLNFHEKLANNISDATLIAVPDSGHFVTLEQPEIVNQHLCNWLKKT